jgi:hypothetical protein
MRKYAMTTGLFLILSPIIFSQNISPDAKTSIGKSSFIAELGGPGIIFSANLDTRFTQSHLGFGGRIGVGFVSAYDDYYDPTTGTYYGGDEQSAITLPVQLNYIFGKNNSPHSLEVGGGITYVSKKLNIMNFDTYGTKDHRTQWFGTFSFMYRRQPVNGGFSWRAGFTPLVGKGYIQAFVGASVGYNF